MLVEPVLCARHCSKLWRNSSEQNETSALGEFVFNHGVGGSEVAENLKRQISRIYKVCQIVTVRGRGEKAEKGKVAILNTAISSLS